MFRKTFASALALAAGLGLGPAAADTLTILHTNDVHSRIEPISKYDGTCRTEDDAEGKCFGGVARLATLIAERRAAAEAAGSAVLLLDGGDQFQGSLMYLTYKGKAEAEFMNAIGYDAMAIGNHEFDDGPEGLAGFLDEVTFPVLAANLDASNEPSLAGRVAPYAILEAGGRKIAVIGAVTADTPEVSKPGDTVSFAEEVESLKAAVAEVQADGIDRIIALTHVGLPLDIRIAQRVEGIDAVVGGHSHTLLSNSVDKARGPYPVMVIGPDARQVPVVQAGAYSKYLGELTLEFDDAGDVTAVSGDTILVDASVAPDPKIAARVAELAGPIEEMKNELVTTIDAPVDGDRANCRAGECEMGNLVTAAMLEATRGQGMTIAIQNGGGLRASIDAGDVTMGDVLTVLPFQNTVATMKLKGVDVVAALEAGVSQVEDGKGRFPQVGGLRYAWSPAVAPNEGRIQEVLVRDGDGWAPIDPDAVYGVVTNNFMRSGGDGYVMFRDNAMEAYDYGPGLEAVLVEHMKTHGAAAAKLDGRIETR